MCITVYVHSTSSLFPHDELRQLYHQAAKDAPLPHGVSIIVICTEILVMVRMATATEATYSFSGFVHNTMRVREYGCPNIAHS